MSPIVYSLFMEIMLYFLFTTLDMTIYDSIKNNFQALLFLVVVLDHLYNLIKI